MAARLTFNELSQNVSGRTLSVDEIVREFIRAIRKAFALGAERAISVPPDFIIRELVPGTTVGSYLNRLKEVTDERQKRENNDLLTWLKDLITTMSYSTTLTDSDYLHETDYAIGLGSAYVTGGLGVSFSGPK